MDLPWFELNSAADLDTNIYKISIEKEENKKEWPIACIFC